MYGNIAERKRGFKGDFVVCGGFIREVFHRCIAVRVFYCVQSNETTAELGD